MRQLHFELRRLAERNRDGSYATQHDRMRMLAQAAEQLHELGYRRMNATSLKPKHVEALVQRWHEEELSTGTMKNRLAAVRWWAEKVGRAHILPRDNAALGVGSRTFVTNESKASEPPDAAALARVGDPHVRMSLRLQREFGLRREEALKIRPTQADRGDHLAIKSSWAKGGKAREVPVLTASQRDLLDQARQLAGRGSLIPAHLKYIQQRGVYDRHTQRAGLDANHGLRHLYAQRRYEQLTGWKAPAAGGPTSKQLTRAQKARDKTARLTISRELGHEREQITAVYLGR